MHKNTLKAGAWLSLLLVGSFIGPAHAGRSCENKPLTETVLIQGLALAEGTALALDAQYQRGGARVVRGWCGWGGPDRT